jgi:hypothetical protein
MSNKKIQNHVHFLKLWLYYIVFPRSVILIGQELINFLCVVLNFLNKMYVQSMYMKCNTNLILDLVLIHTEPNETNKKPKALGRSFDYGPIRKPRIGTYMQVSRLN